ncbi:hypothetical protein VC83_01683 [Pseudogymnoascus destructans]|uniref:Uncharacterized protein n=1 Tax=Pseudogymnoascus destructans TaxID=655981 RepID=A0A177AIK0_9PEZI|nr:uncharacterized protein VC83_01683 [Pseudogymnoascus destructans]OAF61899.1 hypothetical protein VC83_01683 [Pseudogymnoascus destructans]
MTSKTIVERMTGLGGVSELQKDRRTALKEARRYWRVHFSAEQRDKIDDDEGQAPSLADILSSSASPLFAASLPTPLVDLETDARPGPIQNSSVSSVSSVSSLTSLTSLTSINPSLSSPPSPPSPQSILLLLLPLLPLPSLLPTAGQPVNLPIDKEGYLPMGTAISTTTTTPSDKTGRQDDINSTQDRPPQTTPYIDRHAQFLPYTTPKPSPTFPTVSSSTTYPQASMSETLIQ